MSNDNIHFVRITFEPISEQEMDLLLKEDERLNELFADPDVLNYDGYERGKQDFVMYFCGKDADSMASLIIPELSTLPFSNRAVVLKRYGGHGAREETMNLNSAR